jgi:hypothetical protein
MELLEMVYAWLPALFALDVLVFHLTGDHPLAARWWWGRERRPPSLELA